MMCVWICGELLICIVSICLYFVFWVKVRKSSFLNMFFWRVHSFLSCSFQSTVGMQPVNFFLSMGGTILREEKKVEKRNKQNPTKIPVLLFFVILCITCYALHFDLLDLPSLKGAILSCFVLWIETFLMTCLIKVNFESFRWKGLHNICKIENHFSQIYTI